MAHLGDRVAALVDGQLPPDAVERAHAHLAGCRPCRDAVEAERLTKARLGTLRGPEPGASLTQRLLAMGGPNGPLPPRTGHVPGTPRPPAVTLPRATTVPFRLEAEALVPVDSREPVDSRSSVDSPVPVDSPAPAAVASTAVADRPAGRRPVRQDTRGGSSGPGRSRSWPRPRRRSRLAVAAVLGAVAAAGVGISGLTTAGSISSPAPPTVVPPLGTFVRDHARTTSDLPFVDLSAGWQLTSVELDGGAGR